MKAKNSMRWILLTVFLGIVILAFCSNLFKNQNVYVTEYAYCAPSVPEEFDGYRIAVISDMHNSKYAPKVTALLDRVQADCIVFLGDMMQLPDTDISRVCDVIAAEKDRSLIYAVFGNHEASCGYAVRKELSRQLTKSGAAVLLNKAAEIKRGGKTVRLIGIEDTGDAAVDDAKVQEIRDTVQKQARDGQCNILLYHRADLYPKLKDLPVSLILSGHLHGGVVRLPYFGGVIGDAGKTLFPPYTEGVYQEGEDAAAMIVSRGCDYNPSKMRIGNPPEIPVITLHTEKE